MQPMIAPNMPTVSPNRDFRQCLANGRRISAGVRGTRWVVIIAPDGTLVNVPVPAPADADKSLLRDVRRVLAPQGEPLTNLIITSINCTTGAQRRARSFHRMLPLVPNLSYLVGAACLGNTVVAFEGHANDFAAACVDADMLLLDDGMIPFLSPDWAMVATQTLKQPRIICFGRDGRMSKVQSVVEIDGVE
jgi:hypothetical protein